ncbi:MAG TPA: hypothetical protein VJB16_07720, partial [archaeon]|nr:hypothetical protein [archaeon]
MRAWWVVALALLLVPGAAAAPEDWSGDWQHRAPFLFTFPSEACAPFSVSGADLAAAGVNISAVNERTIQPVNPDSRVRGGQAPLAWQLNSYNGEDPPLIASCRAAGSGHDCAALSASNTVGSGDRIEGVLCGREGENVVYVYYNEKGEADKEPRDFSATGLQSSTNTGTGSVWCPAGTASKPEVCVNSKNLQWLFGGGTGTSSGSGSNRVQDSIHFLQGASSSDLTLASEFNINIGVTAFTAGIYGWDTHTDIVRGPVMAQWCGNNTATDVQKDCFTLYDIPSARGIELVKLTHQWWSPTACSAGQLSQLGFHLQFPPSGTADNRIGAGVLAAAMSTTQTALTKSSTPVTTATALKRLPFGANGTTWCGLMDGVTAATGIESLAGAAFITTDYDGYANANPVCSYLSTNGQFATFRPCNGRVGAVDWLVFFRISGDQYHTVGQVTDIALALAATVEGAGVVEDRPAAAG